MKKSSLILTFVLSLIAFTSCNKQVSGDSPAQVAIAVFESITTGDTATLKRSIYINDQIQRDVFNEYFKIAVHSQQYMESTASYKPQYTVVSEKIDGNNAEVILTTKNISGQKVRITVKLLVDEGRWKVNGDHGIWH